jgi:hypothetical protein
VTSTPASAFAALSNQFSRSLARFAHRLDGVDHQIKSHLFQLEPIPPNRGQALRKLSFNRNAAPRHFAARQRYDLQDHFVDVEHVLPHRRLFDEGADPIDNITGTNSALQNKTERPADLLEIWRLNPEPPQSQLEASGTASPYEKEYFRKDGKWGG